MKNTNKDIVQGFFVPWSNEMWWEGEYERKVHGNMDGFR